MGIGADNVSPDSIPLEWSAEKNLAWKYSSPGYGQSSPVVWDGRIYLTSVEGDMKEKFHVVCLRLADGKQIWQKSIDSALKVKSSQYVSRAAPTPVVDSERLITFFENGDLIAWSHSGDQIWKRSLVADYGEIDNEYCVAASPLQTKDSIFVLVDHKSGGYLAKINKANGETTWKVDRSARMAWSSPTLVPFQGTLSVVVSSKGSVDGYDLETGALEWSYDQAAGNSSATPLPFGDGRFLVGASQGRGESAASTNLAMQIVERNGKRTAEKIWDAGRAAVTFGSPIVYRDYAYWVGRNGIVYCLNAKTGVLEYKERIADSVWATPWGIGNRIYFFGKNGETTVIATGPEFKTICTNSFKTAESAPAKTQQPEASDKSAPQVTYGVAAVSGSLLIRTGQTLYCVRHDEN